MKDVHMVCRRLLHGQKNQAKGSKNRRRHALKVGCHQKLKTHLKTRFVSKVVMFEET